MFVLFEPLKSAEPPINSGKVFVIPSNTEAEDCLDAIFGFKLKNFFFCSLIIFSKFFGNLSLTILDISSFIFLLFLL